MAYEQYMGIFAGTPAGQAVAANALDGVALNLHAVGLARELLEDAYHAGGGIDRLSIVEFQRLIEDVLLGREEGRRDYLERWTKGGGWLEGHRAFTLVWPSEALERLASIADLHRFSRLSGRLRSPNGDLARLMADAPTAERYFTPRSRAQFGQTFVWLTPKRAFEEIVDRAARSELNIADACRDALGLLQHQPGDSAGALMALHLPADVIARRLSTRPTFAEAVAHERFATRNQERDKDAYGRAVHLGRLSDGHGMRAGAPMRVTLALTADDFLPGERIHFDVLGPVTTTRGQSKQDNTAAFLQHLCAHHGANALRDALL